MTQPAAATQPQPLHLMSHALCPYVQRAVIALTEKEVPFERTVIDLADKPDWFLALSPLGKTPVLTVGDTPIFESAVIVEYLEDTQPNPLHPADPLARARHRAFIEFASATLNDIAGFYSAPDEPAFQARTRALRQKFARMETVLSTGPYFAGRNFSLVDAAFAPVFRYFDTFDQIADFGILEGFHGVLEWRAALARRSSVEAAVGEDYPALLWDFLRRRDAWLTGLMPGDAAPS